VTLEKNSARGDDGNPAKDELVDPGVASAATGGAEGTMLVINRKSGFIWIGSPRVDGTLPHLVGEDGRPVSPDAVVAGGRYRVRGNLVVRDGAPSAAGQPAEAIGVIANNTLFTAMDPPEPAPGGEGYWLHAVLVPADLPNVRLLHAGNRDTAAALAGRFGDLSYPVETAEDESARRRWEVRYCRADDRGAALRLAAIASRELAQTRGMEARTVAPILGSDCGRAVEPGLRLLLDLSDASR
jgi:hypothetical protein